MYNNHQEERLSVAENAGYTDQSVARELLQLTLRTVSRETALAKKAVLELQQAAEEGYDFPATAQKRIKTLAGLFNLKARDKSIEKLASELAKILLDDISNPELNMNKTLHALASPERILAWKNLGLLHGSASSVMNTAQTLLNSGSEEYDWQRLINQYLCLGIIYSMGSQMSRVIARDALHGLPQDKTDGFNIESLENHYGCLEPVASALINAQVKGIVNISDTSATYDMSRSATLTIIDMLLHENILIFTQGSTADYLAERGYTKNKAVARCGKKMQFFLRGSLPPVWDFGEKIDAVHTMTVFREIAKYAGHPMRNLPFAELSAECFSGRNSCNSLAFRLLGINSYHCISGTEQNTPNIKEFFYNETKKTIGGTMCIASTPKEIAGKIIANFNDARSRICWR
jgi:hydroxylamine reductase (hybrid-cluster protein)